MRRIVIAGTVTSLIELAVAEAVATTTTVIAAADERMFDMPNLTGDILLYRDRRVRDWEQRERPKHRKRKRHGR